MTPYPTDVRFPEQARTAKTRAPQNGMIGFTSPGTSGWVTTSAYSAFSVALERNGTTEH
jgi:hypothetical protein